MIQSIESRFAPFAARIDRLDLFAAFQLFKVGRFEATRSHLITLFSWYSLFRNSTKRYNQRDRKSSAFGPLYPTFRAFNSL